MVEVDISVPDVSGKSAYVYVISAGAEAVKIGKAINPQQRVRELQTGHHQRLELCHSILCKQSEAVDVERRAHHLLKSKRLNGEWFEVGPAEARSAVTQALDLVRRCIPMPVDSMAEKKRSAKVREEEFHPPQSQRLPRVEDLALLRVLLGLGIRYGVFAGGSHHCDLSISEINRQLQGLSDGKPLTTFESFGDAISRIILFWLDYSGLPRANAYRGYCLYPQTKVISSASLDWRQGTFGYSVSSEAVCLMREHGVYPFVQFLESRVTEARKAQLVMEEQAA